MANNKRSKEVTHTIMSSIPSKDTKPELRLRHELWARGLRYRINVRTITGSPDIVFTKAKLAIFCDGDFWHGHNWALRGYSSFDEELTHYSDYWKKKLLANIERDKAVTSSLKEEGWTVLRFWESEINLDVSKCADIVENKYHSLMQLKR